jgi:methylenetetrahydrofolate dehydrogenase (NAD+)
MNSLIAAHRRALPLLLRRRVVIHHPRRSLSSAATAATTATTTTTTARPYSALLPQDDATTTDDCSSSSSSSSSIVDVTNIAWDMRKSVREYTASLLLLDDDNNQKLKLVGILAQDGPHRDDSNFYSDIVGTTFMEDGIDYELIRVFGTQPHAIEAAIQTANARQDVHGILVYYPIFKQQQAAPAVRGPYKNRLTGVFYKNHDDYLRDIVSSGKDVEGLCQSYNTARSFDRNDNDNNNDNSGVVYPCTALSVFKILEAQRETWTGLTITIINRSEILGRPLAAMLSSHGAHVYSIDADSILQFRPGGQQSRVTDMTLELCLQASSIVVSGVPSSSFSLPCEYIMPGSTVVNVSEFENVPEQLILDIPDIQFVPHVGKVTVAALEQNLVQLHKNRNVIN